MVDGSGLENRHTRKGIGGSNPSLSASTRNPNRLGSTVSSPSQNPDSLRLFSLEVEEISTGT